MDDGSMPGMPSTTTRASLLLLMEPAPRICILVDAPGAEFVWLMLTPAALPLIIWKALVVTPSANFPSPTDTTEPVRSLFFTAP